MISFQTNKPNKLTLHIPGGQKINDRELTRNQISLSIPYKEDNIVFEGFNHVPEFINYKFNTSYVIFRIHPGKLLQDGSLLELEKTANVYLNNVNELDPTGFLVTYVQYNRKSDENLIDNKFKIGVSFVSNNGSVVQPYEWDHNLNKTILNIYKFTIQNNKLTNVYEFSSDSINIKGQKYYKWGWEPREGLTSGGSGSTLDIDDTTIDLDKVWSSQKIANELTDKSDNNHSHLESDITNLDKYTQSEVDGLLINKSNINHKHDSQYPVLNNENIIPNHYISPEFKESVVVSDINERDTITGMYEGLRAHVIDASGDSTVDSGGAGYIYHDNSWIKIYEEGYLQLLTDWSDVQNKPDLYTQTQLDGFLANKSDNTHNHDNTYLSVNNNLTDVSNRQISINTLTNSTNASEGQILGVDAQGDVIWRNITESSGDVTTVSWHDVTDKPSNYEPTLHQHEIFEVTNLQTELDNLQAQVNVKSDDGHTHDDRYPVLDNNDRIPSVYIPTRYKESIVVNNITERDSLTDVYEGLRAHVIDATADSNVTNGGAGYIYHDFNWHRIYDEEMLDTTVDWTNIQNKPVLYSQTEIDGFLSNKADNVHTHVEVDITDLDKYTQNEVDTLLTNKSDTNHNHDGSYLSVVDNLSDLTDKQNALNTLTNSSTGSQGQILSLNASGDVVWITADGGSVDTISWANVTDKPTEFTPETHSHVESEISNLDKYSQTQVDNLLTNKADNTHNHDSRYPILDGDNLIPISYIPNEVKESKVVADITARDALTDVYEGLRVHVVDASADSTVNTGGAGYIYHNTSWIKTYEEESLDVTTNWSDVQNKPNLYTVSEIDTALSNKSNIGHTHVEADITDLDKYTQTEVDGFLANKSDNTHTHTEYLTIANNLSDLNDKQLALNTITDITTAQQDQVLAKDSSGNASWKTLDTGGSSGGDVGSEFLIRFGPGTTATERINSADTVLPTGWVAYAGDDGNVDANLGSGQYNIVLDFAASNSGNFVCHSFVTEHRTQGPTAALGILMTDYSLVPSNFRTNLNLTQVVFTDLVNACDSTADIYILIKLAAIPAV